MELSKRVQRIRPSSTLAIAAKASELKEEGKDVVSFSAGEPDFPTTEHICRAAIDAIHHGDTHYTAAAGLLELRQAVCKKLEKDNHLHYTPDQIVVSNGAKHSLNNIFLSILNDGDEVLIPSPYWLSYSVMAEIAGGKAVLVPTTKENGFMLTREALDKAWTPKAKALVLTSPSNPTGMIASQEVLEMVAEFAVEKDLYVISDEIYENLIYQQDKQHISIASLNPEIFRRTIVVNGVSKSYAMTGWRIGYTACEPALAKAMGSLQSHITSAPNTIAQRAAIAALDDDQSCVEEMRLEFEKRRDYIFAREEAMPYVSALKPEGAFYLFMDVSGTYGKKFDGEEITSAADFGRLLLEKKLVALVPCADFGMPDYVRLSYATGMQTIQKGMDRIEAFLNELQ